MGSNAKAANQRIYRTAECEVQKGSNDNRTGTDHQGKGDETGKNLAYINAEIINSKGEVCNEGEAIYFLMNEEKAKEMGFLRCEVE